MTKGVLGFRVLVVVLLAGVLAVLVAGRVVPAKTALTDCGDRPPGPLCAEYARFGLGDCWLEGGSVITAAGNGSGSVWMAVHEPVALEVGLTAVCEVAAPGQTYGGRWAWNARRIEFQRTAGQPPELPAIYKYELRMKVLSLLPLGVEGQFR